ncbi:hypothetical protein P872_02655 [Rhodonellum psychrophilum GCM71 = DSM 17998]|uniref:Tetraacyldisaccharide 4'-kinase n=2 Tax=Rhodonellum TaxID=336827 RepID=U5C1N2_9BACT|nr:MULTISPECIES: tetraacyldisaccharide 4'-kinase [Rhodonellum]ERM83719.1 hypothetical protein P872_02655 [Rhodonellum psychrophilum GCM71 = DSM 17998]SDY89827.1 lipid-A-disaccharide kinase [Rhodonellum ikkaensis]
MRWYDPLLYPIALLYDGVTRLRNGMFDSGQKKSTEFLVPTVVVGNLSMGGTGKTPLVEFLIELLMKDFQLATLSRGYGRKSRGFLLGKEGLGPHEIGDEPFQLLTKYGKQVTVAVGEERVLAIPEILFHRPETELIVLDDAFQHRYVNADYRILLTTYQKPFFRDKVLPVGTLRENAKGAKRADLIIVTKCPEGIPDDQKIIYKAEIRKYSKPDCPVFFAGLKYGTPYSVFGGGQQLKQKVILVSGIANDQVLKAYVEKKFELVETMTYRDHYFYTVEDVQKIRERFDQYQDVMVLTTEKDAGKLKDPKFRDYLIEIPIFALPVKADLNEADQRYIYENITKIVQEKGYIREF